VDVLAAEAGFSGMLEVLPEPVEAPAVVKAGAA
jgi:hypothetical protein